MAGQAVRPSPRRIDFFMALKASHRSHRNGSIIKGPRVIDGFDLALEKVIA